VYDLEAGKMFAAAGSNPFTREALELVVPAVSFRSKANRKIVAELLCHGLMGGASMPQKALHMFHAACQEMVASGDDEQGVFAFMCRQVEQHTFTTGTFTDEGPRMRLQDAMHFFAHSLESLEQRKVFSFCEAIALALLRMDKTRKDDGTALAASASSAGAAASAAIPKEATASAGEAKEAEDEDEAELDGVPASIGAVDKLALRTMLRRSLLRTLVSSIVQLGKREGAEALRSGLDVMLFDLWHGIPTAGSAKAVTVPELIHAVMHPVGAKDTTMRVERVEAALEDGGGSLLSGADATFLCAWARYRSRVWTVSGDRALLEYIETVPGRAAWAGVQVESDPRDAVSLLFRLVQTSSDTPIPLFATTLGPSVLRWSDGRWLVSPVEAGAGGEEWLTKLRTARRAALRAVFGSTDSNGYPHAQVRAAAEAEAASGAAESVAKESASGDSAGGVALCLPADARECIADLTGDDTWATRCLGTAHCNLHRAVQVVLSSDEFATASKVTEDMLAEVAGYLLADGKGNIYDPAVRDSAPKVVASYLEARSKAMPDPSLSSKGRIMVPFEAKVEMELADAAALWNAALASGSAPEMFSMP
jgi:hypothetical protein